MLPSAERLRKTGLFQRVYAARRSVSQNSLTLYVLERQPQSGARLPLAGFVVGKKVYPKSSERNKAKRRLREAYRLLRQDVEGEAQRLNLKRWYAIVWVIQGDISAQSWLELKVNVQHCLEKARDKYGDRRVLKK